MNVRMHARMYAYLLMRTRAYIVYVL